MQCSRQSVVSNLSDEDYRQILQNNEKYITNSTNLSCLLPILRAKGLLTDGEFQLLQEMPPYKVRNRSQLVQILLGKGGGNALNLFIQALHEEKEHLGHKNLARALVGEVSNLKPKSTKKAPAPPTTSPRTTRVSQTLPLDQPFSTSLPSKKCPPPLPRKNRPISAMDVDGEKNKVLVRSPVTFYIKQYP